MDEIKQLIRQARSNEVPHTASTSNTCFVPPSLGEKDVPWSRAIKDALKRRRPFFRLINGYRALKEGVRGLMQGKRGSMDHIKSTLSFMIGSNKVAGRPLNITIEPINTCNLRCPICETGALKLGRSPKHLSLEDFQKMIDKVADHTNTLMFYFMGEPFTNKQSYDMIRYAKSKGIPYITTCTNGDFVDPEKLVESGIDEVNFQIGGMTQETHQTYRVNSNLERVLKNLRETVRLRNERKSKMKILSGFILMKHNEHEVETFNKTMKEIGAIPNVIDPCVRTHEEGLTYLPVDKSHWFYDPEAFANGDLKPRFLPPNECPWIYYSLVIQVNGDVVPCCRDPLGKNVMGNIFTQTMPEIWNGEKYRAFRKQLHTDQGQIEICRLCSSYAPSPLN